MIVNSNTGFGYVTFNGNVVQKLACPVGVDVIAEDGVWTDVEDQDALDAINLFVYNADTLISWALSQVFAEQLIPHMAAFLDFANKATPVSMGNFVAYAAAVELTDTANTIIAKAIELGVDLGGE